MPRPSKRSHTFRRVYIRNIKGKSKLVYRRRKPNLARCANCNAILHGVPRELPYKMRNLSKSSKHPKRIYGGYFCSNCTKLELIKQARK